MKISFSASQPMEVSVGAVKLTVAPEVDVGCANVTLEITQPAEYGDWFSESTNQSPYRNLGNAQINE